MRQTATTKIHLFELSKSGYAFKQTIPFPSGSGYFGEFVNVSRELRIFLINSLLIQVNLWLSPRVDPSLLSELLMIQIQPMDASTLTNAPRGTMERGPSSVPTSPVLVQLVMVMSSGKSDSTHPGLLMFEVTHLTMVGF